MSEFNRVFDQIDEYLLEPDEVTLKARDRLICILVNTLLLALIVLYVDPLDLSLGAFSLSNRCFQKVLDAEPESDFLRHGLVNKDVDHVLNGNLRVELYTVALEPLTSY